MDEGVSWDFIAGILVCIIVMGVLNWVVHRRKQRKETTDGKNDSS